MNASNSSLNTCLLPSELSPKQLESLSFVPGVLSNFDEKEKLPPTARAQWTYVRINPIDFLNRFSNELGLLGVNVAICFINEEPYEDHEKELKTPITVNLIVQPERISQVAEHLQEKNISHLVLEDNKGFALPYLGSIQKTVDALALESLVSYMFIKNSISREAYSSWLSVPKKYLEAKKPQAKVVQNQATSAKTKQEATEKPGIPSDNRKVDQPKENFNYVIYDDTGETAPPIIPEPMETKSKSVVVANPPPKKKKSFLSKFSSSSKSKKESKSQKAKSTAYPIAKFDAAFFVFLGLFNLHCSILLLNFLGTTVDAFASIMIEATTGAAFISLLLTIFVIRPSFRMKERRLWSLVGYIAYIGVAGFQIFRSFSFPDSADYLLPGALTFVFILASVVSSFMRIDRMNANKGKSVNTEEASEEESSSVESVEIEFEATDPSPAPSVSQKAIDLPAPAKRKKKKKESKKIELKPAKKAAPAEKNPEVPAEPAEKAVKLPSQKSIPTKPINDQQKEAIRSRLARKDTLSTPSQPISSESEEQPSSTSDEQKPLSTAEIKARLAERLQKAKATNSGLNNVGKPTQNAEISPKAEDTAMQDNEPRKSVLQKKTIGGRKERANKLSLPNS